VANYLVNQRFYGLYCATKTCNIIFDYLARKESQVQSAN